MGPDLMTVVQLSNGDLVLLAIQVKYRSVGNTYTIDASVLAEAIQTTIPSRFYHRLVRNQLDILPDFSLRVVRL